MYLAEIQKLYCTYVTMMKDLLTYFTIHVFLVVRVSTLVMLELKKKNCTVRILEFSVIIKTSDNIHLLCANEIL